MSVAALFLSLSFSHSANCLYNISCPRQQTLKHKLHIDEYFILFPTCHFGNKEQKLKKLTKTKTKPNQTKLNQTKPNQTLPAWPLRCSDDVNEGQPPRVQNKGQGHSWAVGGWQLCSSENTQGEVGLQSCNSGPVSWQCHQKDWMERSVYYQHHTPPWACSRYTPGSQSAPIGILGSFTIPQTTTPNPPHNLTCQGWHEETRWKRMYSWACTPRVTAVTCQE